MTCWFAGLGDVGFKLNSLLRRVSASRSHVVRSKEFIVIKIQRKAWQLTLKITVNFYFLCLISKSPILHRPILYRLYI